MPIKAIPFYPPDICLQPDASPADALRLMLERGIDHAPICDRDGRFIGIIGTTAILRVLIPVSAQAQGGLSNLRFAGDAVSLLTAHLRDLERLTVGEFARKDLPVLREDSPILEAALLLTQHSAPLPVLDEGGRLLGLLSRRALLAHLVQQAGL
ncbi:MAG: CBS domain-containing protein [Sulfuricella sp.]|nr:CBS domain-containing protein [Sulfuricella sp.]